MDPDQDLYDAADEAIMDCKSVASGGDAQEWGYYNIVEVPTVDDAGNAAQIVILRIVDADGFRTYESYDGIPSAEAAVEAREAEWEASVEMFAEMEV